MSREILVAGVGNLLFTDEGIGVHVARELLARELGDNVEVIEVGTATFDLPRLMEKKDKVVIVDAVLSDSPPGSILKLTPADLKSGTERTLTSMHQFGVLDALTTARQMGSRSETVLIGVVPKDYRTPSMELTPELSQALPAVLSAVLAELGLHA
jgi:hydrogenase maturation protease